MLGSPSRNEELGWRGLVNFYEGGVGWLAAKDLMMTGMKMLADMERVVYLNGNKLLR